MIQPLCSKLNAGALVHGFFDEVAFIVPAVEAVDPNQAMVCRLLLELALAVDGPAYEPARIAAGNYAAGDDLAGQRIALADLLDSIEDLLVCCIDGPGFPRGLLDACEELLGTAECRILSRDLLPHLDRGAFAVLNGDNRCMGVIAVCGSIALAAVGADDKIILGQVDDLLYAALSVLDLLCDLLLGGAVADDVGNGRVIKDLAAVIGDVLAHWQDHGFILIIASEAQCAQIGQTVDVVDVALQIQLHLKCGMPFFKCEHGLPVGPEVRCIELIVEHIVDLLILEGLVGGHEQLQQLGSSTGSKTVLSVGVRVLALFFGDAAQREVRVFLVQMIVLGKNGLAGIYDRGDGLKQIPHTLEVVIHLTSAAHDEALGCVVDAVA